ncbi:Dyp-type peroxidase [Sandaracinus amylolyticus]|uniref:Dyp-type peroxidase n=1 Tax=Sandaracinus amylolyticus TaxID=927083 RepID=UPI00069DC312|nr:Dyp-type peroxidase domain-containing protein [Sandaracinus amylolyticus]
MRDPRPQPALFHGPGAHAAVVVWRARDGVSTAFLRMRATALIDRSVLVAIAPPLLDAHEREALPAERVLPRAHAGRTMPSTRGSVLVQIASDERDGLIEALRRADALLGTIADRDEEIEGGWPHDRREPFGFREPRVPTHDDVRAALVHEGPLEGATFLLHQRYVQHRARFFARREADRERVVGRTTEGVAISDAPQRAHVRRVHQHAMVRRGFPYRAWGDEGLVYVAIARAPEIFEQTLDAMLGARDGITDAMLDYVEAIGGGLYVVPPL